MKDIILLKQGETVLKGLNRRYFEQKLVSNIRKRLKPMGEFRVYCVQSTVYVEPESETADMDAAFDALSKTFGVVALSRAAACEKDEDAIARLAIEYLREDMLAAESFKVETKRSDKSFHMTSIQLSQYVGGRLAEAYPETRVDVRHPELTVHLEVRDYAAYVHAAPAPGAGGHPALRRYRQPRLHMDDSPPRREVHTRTLLLLPLYLRGGQGKGGGARAAAHALVRADVP